jgi:hypothetical protein
MFGKLFIIYLVPIVNNIKVLLQVEYYFPY